MRYFIIVLTLLTNIFALNDVTKPYNFSPRDTIKATKFNSNFDTLYNRINQNNDSIDVGFIRWYDLESHDSTLSYAEFDTVKTEFIRLDTSATVPNVKGAITWDNDNRCVAVALGNNVIWQSNQEQHQYARNGSGSGVVDGQCVYIDGATGSRLTFGLANASNPSQSLAVIGLATETIANGDLGLITTYGLVNNLNTSAWSEGDILYLSTTNGVLTNTPPAKGNRLVIVGVVVRDHATLGSICVCVNKFPFLAELPDVDTTGKANGRALGYNSSTGIWETADTLKADSIAVTGGIKSQNLWAYNSTSSGSYIGLFKSQGALPGYPSLYVPVLKSDFPYIHIATNNEYVSKIGEEYFELIDTSNSSLYKFKVIKDTTTVKIIKSDSLQLGSGSYLKTYVEGSFPCTLKTSDVTVQQIDIAYYTKVGNILTVSFPNLSGTSNSTSLLLYCNLPYEPKQTVATYNYSAGYFRVTNSGSTLDGSYLYTSLHTNYITMIVPSGFTASGTKGITPCTISYITE